MIPPAQDEDNQAPAFDADAASRELRRYFARHNRQALFLTALSLGASAALWALTYAFVYWFSLVGVTVSRSLNADTLNQVNNPELLGTHFPEWFALSAGVSLVVAAFVRRQGRVAWLREARLYLLWVVVELLMAVPDVTFSVWGNLSAVTRLRRREAREAWRLLQRINQEGGRMNLANLRQEIDDERILQRVMYGLQIVGLVGVRESRDGWYLYLQNREAFAALLSHAQGSV